MIRYPNGKSYQPKTAASSLQKKPSYSNRGMTLEDDLNETNMYYQSHSIAVIHKKPTPVQIVQVDYPKRSAAVIKEAYFKQSSTTDYNGVYKGRYIDFEAKETKSRTSFPLQNFHDHQIEHMKQVVAQDGICFVIISAFEEIYFLEAEKLFYFWERKKQNGRKSIRKDELQEAAHPISLGYSPRIDYIKIIDQLYFSPS
ncbi:Holliday junction resolvase RecU [Bacillus sp. GM2]|uniref:Holliday junction resolvase RecU n=9 Tax=Bacillus TaxID=1386 RepID=RECU_BACLD|nr:MULTISPECIES: Holliday junction resolvase RecU [Bacillus]Q65I68.1 RecName: Full=Holliday junction resolvase RecU; AltName: Full=Recombination protein U homolog [Bacillus licheniformis DSM 13 = ATCC 14580]ETB69510.1 recombinase RecU [Bacillus sp. CPSM8]KUL06917.1 recombinase RecU [Bacillus licheniformis LMG 7559]KUL18768.1 recombinase RecU [Bacillus licheniformis LMG 6934]MBC8623302.1 Holliday junction resolvase RecU [Robertmurraya crescens]MBJ7888382.1 Holliday junction resolvase RecU [Bac